MTKSYLNEEIKKLANELADDYCMSVVASLEPYFVLVQDGCCQDAAMKITDSVKSRVDAFLGRIEKRCTESALNIEEVVQPQGVTVDAVLVVEPTAEEVVACKDDALEASTEK